MDIHALTPVEAEKLVEMFDWYKRFQDSSIEANDIATPIVGNDIYVAVPKAATGIPGRNGLTPGRGICDVWQIERVNKVLKLAHPDQLVYNLSVDPVDSTYIPIGKTKYGRWIVLAGSPSTQKARVCVKGQLVSSIQPGEGGTMTRLVCLWNPLDIPLTDPLPVFNCTTEVLNAGDTHEACFNCECKFVITNCCPLGSADCPNCQFECADNYDIILPGDMFPANSICACLNGATVPMQFMFDCDYATETPGPFIIESCTDPNWDGLEINPCECQGTTFAGGGNNCIPDQGTDPDCRYCGGDNITPCTYCKADCSHGLRQAGGNLICVDNNWELDLDIGTAGPCPNIGIAMSSLNYSYPADGNCPPRKMSVDVVIANGCNDPALQCLPDTFTVELEVVPRNN